MSTTADGVTYDGEWLQLRLPVFMRLTAYSVSRQDPTLNYNAPVDWAMLGSNTGSTWFLLDSRTDHTWPERTADFVPNASSTATFQYFRVVGQRVSYNTSFCVGELLLSGAV